MAIRIPPQHRASVVRFTAAETSVLQSLRRTIDASAPNDIEIRRAFEEAGFSATDFQAIMSMSVLSVNHDMPASEIALDIMETLGDEAGGSDIAILLDSPVLRTVAKAYDLQYASERSMHTFRILTDVRPVFGESGEDVEGAIVLHRVHLSYFGDKGISDMHFSADPEDLQHMIEQINRALTKDAAAKRFVNKAGVEVVSYTADEEA